MTGPPLVRRGGHPVAAGGNLRRRRPHRGATCRAGRAGAAGGRRYGRCCRLQAAINAGQAAEKVRYAWTSKVRKAK